MNPGARAARGEALLFLHADTRLGAGALGRISRALEDRAVVGGGFARRYDSASALLRHVSFGGILRLHDLPGAFAHLLGAE